MSGKVIFGSRVWFDELLGIRFALKVGGREKSARIRQMFAEGRLDWQDDGSLAGAYEEEEAFGLTGMIFLFWKSWHLVRRERNLVRKFRQRWK